MFLLAPYPWLISSHVLGLPESCKIFLACRHLAWSKIIETFCALLLLEYITDALGATNLHDFNSAVWLMEKQNRCLSHTAGDIQRAVSGIICVNVVWLPQNLARLNTSFVLSQQFLQMWRERFNDKRFLRVLLLIEFMVRDFCMVIVQSSLFLTSKFFIPILQPMFSSCWFAGCRGSLRGSSSSPQPQASQLQPSTFDRTTDLCLT